MYSYNFYSLFHNIKMSTASYRHKAAYSASQSDWNEYLKSQKRHNIRIFSKINNNGRIRSTRKIISKHLRKKFWLCKISGFHPIFKGQESLPWVKNPPPLKMGPIGYPEKSVKNYHYTLHNSPEERSSQAVALL